MNQTNNNVTTPIIIKKYQNRKLYDTSLSQYVSSDDVIDMVRENKEFKVIDAVTNEDVTRNVLMMSLSKLNNLSTQEIVAFIRR